MPVELIILCGFLGSGKTTLLIDFLRNNVAGDTGVIVNEAGEVDVDGAILHDADSAVPMTLLGNGCVCCSLRSSLVHTIEVLLDAPRPAGKSPLTRIVLETSGLSRPGPIIGSLADPQLARRQLRVSVLSTFDSEAGGLRPTQFDEAAAQLAAAQRIVLTKTDKVDARAVAHCRDTAIVVNPLAEVVADSDREQAVRQAFAPMRSLDLGEGALRALLSPRLRLAHPRIHVMAGQLRGGADWDDLAVWLDDLAGYCGDRLLRLKAIVDVPSFATPVLVQSVGTTFSAPQPLRERRPGGGGIVVITRDADADLVNAMDEHAPVHLKPLVGATARRSSRPVDGKPRAG